MLLGAPTDRDTHDKVFLHCEFVGSLARTRGSCVRYDTTDNAGVSAIGYETRGYRVISSSAGEQTGVAGVLEDDVDAVPSTGRGRPVLVQCYGFHDAINVAPTAGNAGEAIIVSSGVGNGIVDARSVSSIANPFVGFGVILEAATGSSTIPCFIRAMQTG